MIDYARNAEIPVQFNIPFTQYLLPHGRKNEVSIERSKDIYDKAMDIIEAGHCFEVEMLNNGLIHMTITNNDDDQNGEIVNNGPEVPIAVDRMISRFHERQFSPSPLAQEEEAHEKQSGDSRPLRTALYVQDLRE